MRNSLVICGMVVLTGLATQASASTITYVTPPGATTAGPVSASATFTTAAGQLAITIQDLLADPVTVAQLPSDLFFTLSGGLTTGTLTASSGQERVVNADGTFTDGAVVSAGWLLSSSLGVFHLDDLNGGAGPTHLIIGPPDGGGLYSSANSSIAGNGPHNPFLNGSAMFILSIPGMTADTTVTSATFSFGSVSGVNVPGGGGGGSTIPEPASLLMVGVGLLGAGRRFRTVRAR